MLFNQQGLDTGSRYLDSRPHSISLFFSRSNPTFVLQWKFTTDKSRGRSSCQQRNSWKPPYVGRCLGECDVISCPFYFCRFTEMIKNQSIKTDFAQLVQISFVSCSTWLRDNQPWDVKTDDTIISRLALFKAHTPALDGFWWSTQILQSRYVVLMQLPRRFCLLI